MIVSDGAAVYEKPDFDSKVIEFAPFQTVVTISRRTFAGRDGLGLFHKVRVKGKIGYIPDTDVRLTTKELEKHEEAQKEQPKSKVVNDQPKSFAFEKDEEESGRAPIYLTRYLGLAAAQVRFTEKFEGRRLSDQMLMYGLRMTGPGTLFDGPPLDFNLWFSTESPEYYNRFSSNVHGFLLFGDIMALMPMINLDDWVVNYGFGLTWNFTRYHCQIRGEDTDSLDFRIGVDVGLGAGWRFAKHWIARADAKYYIEKSLYPGYLMSVQMEY